VLLARIGVGVGEATLTPSANSLIADCFPRERVPFAISVFQAAASIGSGLAFVLGGIVLHFVEQSGPRQFPVLGTLGGWQQVFVYCALPGFLLVPFILAVREPQRRYLAGGQGKGHGARLPDVLAFYRQNAATLFLHHFGFLCLSLMGFAFVFWTVSFFSRVHGMEPSTAAQGFGWIFAIAGALGVMWAPLLAARFRRVGQSDANIKAAMIGGVLAMPFIMIVQLMPTAFWAFVFYVPAVFFAGSPFGLAYGSLPLITPPQMRAVICSVFMFIVNLGMLLGPPIAGLFNDRIFPQSDGVRYSLLTITPIFGLAGLVLLTLCRKHYAASLRAAELQESTAAAAAARA
jgi:MFS family permease